LGIERYLMLIAFKGFTALVALLHFGFLILEMFLWATPTGMKIFRMTETQAQMTKVLAQNQGLYNGFLSAGLIYGLVTSDMKVTVLFLVFVLIAGIYGSLTASPTIIYVQAMPALIAIIIRFFL
jgi:putative membrane protein